MPEKNIPTYTWERASAAARDIIAEILPACYQIQIAGSIRRCCKEVHDIDLVVSPRYTIREVNGLFDTIPVNDGPLSLYTLLRHCTNFTLPKSEARILRCTFAGIPVELYLCEPGESNLYALLQMRTGSQAHNAWLARRAIDRGLHYKAGYGIYTSDGETRMDDGSEEGVYRVLGLEWPNPINRN